jgi:hypothetical protein
VYQFGYPVYVVQQLERVPFKIHCNILSYVCLLSKYINNTIIVNSNYKYYDYTRSLVNRKTNYVIFCKMYRIAGLLCELLELFAKCMEYFNNFHFFSDYFSIKGKYRYSKTVNCDKNKNYAYIFYFRYIFKYYK